MTKRNLDELDQLRDENKELKEKVKSLSRELKTLRKEFRVEYDQEQLIKEEYENKVPKKQRCTHCERGDLEVIELGTIRKFLKCTVCDYRKVIKN